MVTAERQLEIACELARSNEFHRIVFLCKPDQFVKLQLGLSDCSIHLDCRRVKFKNGATITFLDPATVDAHPEYTNAYLVTALFYTEESKATSKAISSLQHRLRSTKIAQLKTYHPFGYTEWKGGERYE